MAFSGQLGTPQSQLGNIVLGYGAGQLAGTAALQGVELGSIGPIYDFAMGFDPGTGQATMYGYVLTGGGTWSETTQLAEVARLIQVSSASTTDRDLVRWPKVSQGDWTRGERQLIFVDTGRYYSSDGTLDVSQAGALQLFPAGQYTNYTLTGTYNKLPLVTDGTNWYLGLSQTGKNLLIGNASGVVSYNVTGGEILDMVMTPYGVFYATATGIYSVTSAGVSTAMLSAEEGVSPTAKQSLGYFADKLYWINSTDTKIRSCNAVSAGTASDLVTAGAFETHYSMLASSSSGLFYTKYRELSATSLQRQTVVYSNNGTTETRLGDFTGLAKAACEVNGTTYMLAQQFQPSNRSDYTLYSITSSVANGTVMSILDDTRGILFPDFWANNPSPTSYCTAGVSGDSRFLYIAWPGLQGRRLDLVSGGISACGGDGRAGLASIAAHRLVNTTSVGLVDVSAAGTTARVGVFNGAATQGSLVTSYYDFNTPALVKAWRAVEIEMYQPMPSGASVQLGFALEAASGFTPMSIQQTQPNIYTAYFPAKTKASRCRLQLTLVANASGASPQVASIATKANLARVWKGTASCKRNQLLRNGTQDTQRPTLLIANFQNAYQNEGKIIVFVPSPNAPGYAEQVTAIMQDYNWSSAIPGARATEQSPWELEGDVEFALTEDF